jgi:hypothetical protein
MEGRFGPQAGQIDDLSSMGLTSLLFYLREVILQDPVALRALFPNHSVWNHPVFRHPAYAPFACKVEACLRGGEAPSQLSMLNQAVPLIAGELRALGAMVLRSQQLQQYERHEEQQKQ